MKRCPKCGVENPDSAGYCNLCLTEFEVGLSPGAEALPDPPCSSNSDLLPGSGETNPQSPPLAPPSDYYAQFPERYPPGAIPQQTPTPVTKMGTSRNWILVALLVALVVGGGVAAIIFLSRGGTKTYSSSHSEISFEYPRSFVQINKEELLGNPAVSAYDIAQLNEIILANDEKDFDVMIAAGSTFGVPIGEEQNYLETVKRGFESQAAIEAREAGAEVEYNARDINISGETGLEAEVSITMGTLAANMRVVAVAHQGNAYVLIFFTADPWSEHESEYNDFIKSVKFKDQSLE